MPPTINAPMVAQMIEVRLMPLISVAESAPGSRRPPMAPPTMAPTMPKMTVLIRPFGVPRNRVGDPTGDAADH